MATHLLECFPYAEGANTYALGAGPKLNWNTWTGDLTCTTLVSDGRGIRKYCTMPAGTNLNYNRLPNLTTLAMGWLFTVPSTAADNLWCEFWDGGTSMGIWGMAAGGKVVYNISIRPDLGEAADLRYTAANALSVGVATYVEIKVVFHNSAGTVEVRYDGISQGISTGLDTLNAGTACDILKLGANTAWDDWHSSNEFADMYVADDFRVPQKYWYAKIDAAGSASDFTPAAGTNQAAVDEIGSDGDATYNESTLVGDKDSLGHSAVPLVAPLIVHPIIMAKHNGGGGNLQVGLTSGATEDLSATQAAAADYEGVYGDFYETDPDTAIAWTIGGFQATELTYKHVA